MGLFIRKVRTASGATAVQIASKQYGVQKIVEHIGSAHTPEDLEFLLEVARTKIQAGQLAFDLDRLAPQKVTATPEIVGSQARVLWDVLEHAYREVGFDSVGTDSFKRLVLARIIEPTSKADTIRVLAEIGVKSPSLRTIWRTLARCVEEDWRSQLADAALRKVTAAGALQVVMYDVTTLYFEAEHEDALRKVGMSKERRVDPQILVGLLVDQVGFPLEVHAFEGNRGETTTLLPVLNGFRKRYGNSDVVVVADAGMLSASNLNALEDAGFDFIVASRTGSAPKDLAEHYESVGNLFEDGQIIETIRPMGKGAYRRDRRVVWQYSRKREKRDNVTLNKQIDRAEQIGRELGRGREGPLVSRVEGLRHLDQHRQAHRRRGGGRVSRSVPCRGVVPDGEERPQGAADVPSRAGLDRGAPHDRVRRSRGHPARHGEIGLLDQADRPSAAPGPGRGDLATRAAHHGHDPAGRRGRRYRRETPAERGALKWHDSGQTWNTECTGPQAACPSSSTSSMSTAVPASFRSSSASSC